MSFEFIKKSILKKDLIFKGKEKSDFKVPLYNPNTHYIELTRSKYYNALLTLRHYLKLSSDYFFSFVQDSINVDLFIMTPSVSSPIGPGSDSEAVPIKFGKLTTFLVDSSQFGFEPLLMNDFNKVFCYLPSMRGEDHDKRHLNQFYHCEFELKGKIGELTSIIEKYIKELSSTILLMDNIVDNISNNSQLTKESLKRIINIDKFPEISFDEAVDILVKNNKKNLINFTKHGNDISANGEIELMKILNIKTPIWIKNFDRDRVPFYQKPDPNNINKVLNADLLFPPILDNSFGGEVVGCGERQNVASEMYESLNRQNLQTDPYEWYINLRKIPEYSITSGFGMGIERFITWVLAKDDIKDAIIYPRLKNILTYP